MGYLLVGVAVLIVVAFVYHWRLSGASSSTVKAVQEVNVGPHEFRRAAPRELPATGILFMAAPMAAYMAGHVIEVTGGFGI